MALRNAFGNLALDATVQSVYTWLQARLGAKATASSIAVNIANDQTVAVSAASLPLPSGASTAANQTTANTSLSSIDGKLPVLSSGRVPVDVGSSINVGEVEIKNDTGNPVPMSATSLPLPTGAATAANQTTGNASLSSIDGKLPALSVGGRVLVDGSGVTQPVSGTVTATGPLTDAQLRASAVPVSGPLTDTQLRATAVPISAASLPLPTGAATAAKQPALGTAGTPSADVITVQGAASGTSLPVSAANLPLPTGAATSALQSTANTSLASIDGKTPALVSGRQPVDGSGVTQPISAASLPLPTGAATETTLSNVNTKLPSLVSGSLPVLVQNGQLEIQNDTGNPIPVGPAATQVLSGSASANNTDLFSVDCSAFRSINFQITGTWVGTITFQVSNDNTNWFSYGLFISTGGNGVAASTTSNNAFFGSLAGFNFVRIRFTAYTSGTANVTGFLLREPVFTALNTSGGAMLINGSTASSGVSLSTLNSAATTNATSVKTSAGNLYGISAMNASATTKFVRFFNKASAPTVGTDVPIMVVAIPATSSKEIEYVPAMRFSTGIAFAITGGAAATDSTAVAAGDVQLVVSFA